MFLKICIYSFFILDLDASETNSIALTSRDCRLRTLTEKFGMHFFASASQSSHNY